LIVALADLSGPVASGFVSGAAQNVADMTEVGGFICLVDESDRERERAEGLRLEETRGNQHLPGIGAPAMQLDLPAFRNDRSIPNLTGRGAECCKMRSVFCL
jgi:hypothetical protein